MPVEVRLLGVGASAGTPVVGCHCATCQSTEPKNKRTRSSAWIKINDCHLLIDSGPDLRLQLLREGIQQIDAVLYTHEHADHLHGIDDLRSFCYQLGGALPVFGQALMMQAIAQRFSYATQGSYHGKPLLQLLSIEGAFSFNRVMVTPIPLLHGKSLIYGYRIANIAYLTDVSVIPEASYPLLGGLELLLLDCLRYQPHPTHMHVQKAIDTALRIQAKRTLLIHMAHELEYHQINQQLPSGIAAAYDGMRIYLES